MLRAGPRLSRHTSRGNYSRTVKGDGITAVIIEPMKILAGSTFPHPVTRACARPWDKHGVALTFDETRTGFRLDLSEGRARPHQACLATLGKLCQADGRYRRLLLAAIS
jgi:glutamate-1-semialdehyde aminotransferase